MTTSLPSNAQTVFVFDLPYAIPLPDGLYQVKVGLHVGKIEIKRIQRQNIGQLILSNNSQMPFDKYGRSSFSKIVMTLPWIVDFQERGRSPILFSITPRYRAKEIVLSFLNRFIETVRYVTGEYWVELERYQDIFNYETFYLDGIRRLSPTRIAIMENGVGGVTMGGSPPFQMDEGKIRQLTDLLINESELDASRIFILNSKDACLQEDFRLAIIESVTALEIVLYKFIRQQGKKLEIPKRELNNFIIDVGLTGNISVVLKMLTKGLEQIDDEIIEKCKGAITIRNKILHEGFRDISTDTENRIIAIEQMLEYLNKLIAKITS
jgi:hypothetical protein